MHSWRVYIDVHGRRRNVDVHCWSIHVHSYIHVDIHRVYTEGGKLKVDGRHYLWMPVRRRVEVVVQWNEGIDQHGLPNNW